MKITETFPLLILSILIAGSMTVQATTPNQTDGVRLSHSWQDRQQAPIIETVQEDQGETYVSLSNGAELRLRPVYYYVMGWDEGDGNTYRLFRREFESIAEIFALSAQTDCWSRPWSERKKPYHRIEFVVGQPTQVILPPSDSYVLWEHRWSPPRYYKEHNPVENLDLWAWFNINPVTTIPLNFSDTSINLAPLRANLYEHPNDKEFYHDPFPSSTSLCTLGHAHLIEADLLKFEDLVESRTGGDLQFKHSQIRARMTDDALERGEWQGWEVDDQILALYRDNGVYELVNTSKGNSVLEVYLSDPGRSDLRYYPIFSELPESQTLQR